MRKVRVISSAVLLLAGTGGASAQQTPLAPIPWSPFSLSPGTQAIVNFGYRGLSANGDRARWERYRDLEAGALVGGNLSWENHRSAFQLNAVNLGYRDQYLAAGYNQFGKLKLSAVWNSVPLNYGYNTMTPWKYMGNNVWSLDWATRTAVQNKTAFAVGATAADYDKPSIYRTLATPFTLQSRRDIMSLGAKYQVMNALGLDLGLKSTRRSGDQPFGGSFAFGAVNEKPMRLGDWTNEVTAAVEWAKRGNSLLRAEWLGSWYRNDFLSITWDNPVLATDYSNGKAPPSGPYDPSGYSNGNGPAYGRMALPPSSGMNTFSLVGLQKLPGRSTLNGQFSYAIMKQNEELIPWTTNSVIMSPVVLAAFPHLAELPRPTAEAEVRAVNALLNFTTRPHRYFGLEARYRYNERDNRTPMFDGTEYVRFDAVPEEGGRESQYHNITRNTFETAATLTMIPSTAVKVGYIFDDVKRTNRVFGGMRDNTFRASLDTYGNQYFMVRGIYERTARSGREFSLEALEEGGAQPGLRFYDEAPLDRDRGTLILQITPHEKFDLGLSVAAGKDKYQGEGQEFGLLDNSNTSYNATLNLYPVTWATLSGSFGYEKFSALQKSRNANPLSSNPAAYQSWTDPNRDWNLDNDETIKTLGLSVDLIKPLPRTDFRISYDLSKSDNAYVYSGPRIEELSTNVALTPGDTKPCGATSTAPCFEQLPPITNTWHQLKVGVTHMFNATYGASVYYSWEKLNIVDYASRNLADGSPRIDPLGGIMTGYGNRPYKGQTFIVQLIYRFGAGPTF